MLPAVRSLPEVALAILTGVGVFLVLEAGLYLLRRRGSRLGRRTSSHLWAVSVALLAWVLAAAPARAMWFRMIGALAVMLSAWVLFRLVDELVLRRPWDPGRGPMVPKLARDVLGFVVLVGAGIAVATTILDQPLPAVLVSSTVISAVVGLALQDTLKNVFAGMALELENTFERGDWLLIDDEPAQVQDTTWRSVKLRTQEGIEIYVPSGELAAGRITRLGAGLRPVALRIEVGVSYEAAPGRVKRVLAQAAASAPKIVETPAPEAFAVELGESGMRYRVRAWTRNVHQLTRVRDEVTSRIWYALKREGLEIPFPIRTTRLQSIPAEARRREEGERRSAASTFDGVTLFHDLESEDRERLAAAARRERYDAGEVLVEEGEEGDTLFVVESGRVEISRRGQHEAVGEVEVAELGPGAFFGETSMLTGEPRSATVTAAEDTVVLVLPRAALAPLLEERPELAEGLSQAVVDRRLQSQAVIEEHLQSASFRTPAAEARSVLDRIRRLFGL